MLLNLQRKARQEGLQKWTSLFWSIFQEKGEGNMAINELVLAGLLGGIGGLTRGVVGLLKALALKRKILWSYWAITVTIAMIIGVFTGIVFNFDPRLSLLAGYAGTDILEGIYKSFKTEKVMVVPAKK